MEGLEERSTIFRQFYATLTPRQRTLLSVGALDSKMLTPAQLEILQRLEPYLKGMTREQCARLGKMDTFTEGYQAGQRTGNTVGVLIVAAVVIFVVVIVLSAIVR